MININIQILSLVVSFLYGIFFYIILEVNYRFLTSSSKIIKVLSSLLFVLFHALLYFIILLYINNGYIHLYFLICILVGNFFCKVVYKWFVNKNVIWYTKNKKSR